MTDILGPKHTYKGPEIKIIIVVLGSKLNSDGTPSDILVKRIKDSIAWYKFLSGYGTVSLLLSGGSSKKKGLKSYLETFIYSENESETMKKMVIEGGLPKDELILEKKSKNTIEKARHTRNILKDIHYDELYLLTSDFHMKRASYIFETFVDPGVRTLTSSWDPNLEKEREENLLDKLIPEQILPPPSINNKTKVSETLETNYQL